MTFHSTYKTRLVYVFRINYKTHNGCLKIGQTSALNISTENPNSKTLNFYAKKRIDSYTRTAGISYELLHTETATYIDDNNQIKSFTDNDLRSVLYRSGVEKKFFDIDSRADEWVISNLETVVKAIKSIKKGKRSIYVDKFQSEDDPIIFRKEQKEAVKKTIKQFSIGNEMLWFAKMRFGKTIASLQVIKELKIKRTLIITHRPIVNQQWFEEFFKVFKKTDGYYYGSRNKGDLLHNLENDVKNEGKKYIYFSSIQDLRGSEKVGGNFEKKSRPIFK